MAEGRLDFKVAVDVAIQPLLELKKGIEDTKLSFDAFKKAQASNTAAQNAAAASNDKLAASLKTRAAINKEAARSLTVEREALRSLASEQRKNSVAIKEGALAAKENFRIQRQTLSSNAALVKAHRSIAEILNKRKIEEKALGIVANENITLTKEEARSLGILSAAALDVISANEKLIAQQRAKGDGATRKIKAETLALEEQNRALDEIARKKAFADAGLAPSGKPLAEQAAIDEEKANRRISESNFRRFKQENSKQIALIKERAEVEKLTADNTLIKRRAELTVLKEKLALVEKAALLEARSAAGLGPPGGTGGAGGGGRGGRGRADDNERFNRSLEKTNSLGNRISFTFRRLFGILAAFTIARRLVQSFNDSIRAAIQFNAKLEQARLGMASLFLASGLVTNALGENVSASEGLAIAQAEARRQTVALQKEALQTAATFEQLAESFQVAISPGLSAGLDLDQIRQLVVRISQAAAAIGVPQQQLSEEIRSLLQGTIRVRDTRIAVALGITNTDIRRAKELGTLADFLEDRFSAFAEAGDEVEKTFTVLLTNTRDALVQLAGTAGLGFFDELKGLFEDIIDSVRVVNDDLGQIEFNEEALETANVFFDILKNSVVEARKLGQSLDSDTFQTIATAIGGTLGVAFTSLRVGLEIFVDGIGLASTALVTIFTLLSDIGNVFKGLIPDGFERAIASIVKSMATWLIAGKAILVVFAGIKKIIVTLVIAKVVAGFDKLKIVLAILLVSIDRLLPKMKSMALAFGALAIKVIAAATAIVALVAGWRTLTEETDEQTKHVNALSDEYNSLLVLQREVQKNLDNPFIDIEETDKKLSKIFIRLEELSTELQDLGIDPDNFESETITEKFAKNFKAVIEDAGKALTGFFEDALGGGEKEISIVADLFESLPGAIAAGTQQFNEQLELLRELEETAKDTNALFKITNETLGAGGSVFQQRLEFAQAELEIERQTKQLRASQKQAQAAIEAALIKEHRLRQEIQTFSEGQRNFIAGAEATLQGQAKLLSEIAKLEKERFLLAAEAKKEEQAGNADAAIALREQAKLVDERIKSEQQIFKIQKDALAAAGKAVFSEEEAEAFTRAKKIAEELSIALATIGANKETEAQIDERILQLQTAIRDIAGTRVRTLAVQQTREARIQTQELKTQAILEKDLLDARSQFNLGPRKEAIALAREEVRQQENRLDLLEEETSTRLRNIEIAKESASTIFDLAALEAQRIAVQNETNAALKVQLLLLEQAKQKVDELRQQDQRPILTGIKKAFADFAREGLDTFTQTVQLMRNVFEGFVTFAADSITSIFDPKNTQTAKQRLGRFLLEISNQIIAMLIRIAIIKAALGLDSLFGGKGDAPKSFTTAGGGQFGLAAGVKKGGPIKKKKVTSLPHLIGPQRGANTGGGIGKALKAPNSKDTQPIWAQPGEWMMKLASVRKYGSNVMNAINQGLIDPLALKAMAGSRALGRAVRRPTRPYFQSGGLVSERVGKAQAGSQSTSESSPPVGFLLASEEQMDMFINGGKGSMFRFLEENSQTIRPLLGL